MLFFNFLLLLFLAFFVSPLHAINITAVGSPTYWPFVKAWADAYNLLVPDFNINFQSTATGLNGIATLVNATVAGNKTIDLVLADNATPTTAQYKAVGLQTVPMFGTTIAAQVNFNFSKDIRLTGAALASIYMGDITNWNDPNITISNPGLTMPNATILVFYRTDTGPSSLFSNYLSHESPKWNATYGQSQTFPMTLRSKPNFYGYPDLVSINGAVAGTRNSIGYVQWYAIVRDPSLHSAHLYNKYSGLETTPTNLSPSSIKFNPLLNAVSVIDPPGDNTTYPIVSSVGFVMPTVPGDCTKAREIYKFLRWAYTSPNAKQATIQLGATPLNDNNTNHVLAALQNIQCNGQSIGAYEADTGKASYDYIFIVISTIFLVLATALSALHTLYFRHTKILLIYTLVFVFGTILTLASSYTWWIIPDSNSACLSRIWTLSLGFSIMLGTMFSRTWQLQEIYYLQKDGLNAISKKVSTNRTYIQLAVTLFGVIILNFLILIVWTAVDPLTSTFIISDEINLSGYWTCKSHNFVPWLITELIFFLFLLCFGIYVIYNTWSFQRAVVLSETRWVLFALYNVILNIFAAAPFLGFGNFDDNTISLIVIASIDVSAGSIAIAVLLPRVLVNFNYSTSSDHQKKTNMSGAGPQSQGQNVSQVAMVKSKGRRPSRTPEEELAKRLEAPLPLEGTVELQTLRLDNNLTPVNEPTELESPSTHALATLNEQPEHSELLDTSHRDVDSPSRHPAPVRTDDLQWSENPIKDEGETS